MKNKIIALGIRKVPAIKLFDILIEDIHSQGEEPDLSAIDSTVGLTYHEVLEWITSGGDWVFEVTEHKNPENVYLRGTTYEDMNNARKGEEQIAIGELSEAELGEINKIIHRKRMKQFGSK